MKPITNLAPCHPAGGFSALILNFLTRAAGFRGGLSSLAFAASLALLMACGGIPVPVSAQTSASADELDLAIRETSDYLNKQLPSGNKLVILNIQSEFPALSEYIIDELIANTVNDRIFSVVDRQQLDTIRAEQNFQYSGEVDDETAQSLGRLAGAQIIVSGAVSRIGDLYRLRIRALSVQTAQIAGQFNRNIPAGRTVSALAQSRATGYGGGATAVRASPTVSSGTPAAPASATPATPAPAMSATKDTYAIGDTGPAGGIIFYDKGNTTGGWRYLEAAPASTEWTDVQWAANSGSDVDGTKNGIGEGKKNTQAIVDYSLRTGQSMPAARQCNRLKYGGYDDWFLPSQVELGLMYLNLKEDGIGGFGSDRYWSSTQQPGDSYDAYTQRFSDGYQDDRSKTSKHLVRAIRQF